MIKILKEFKKGDKIIYGYEGTPAGSAVVARDINKDYLGHVEYLLDNGKAYISMINVESQYRRMGIAKGMIRFLAKDFDYATEIDWGYMSGPGYELKQSMDKELR